MDRNKIRIAPIDSIIVALRKESVDRNTFAKNPMIGIDKSLSARRAWIEIGILFNYKEVLCSRSPQGERG